MKLVTLIILVCSMLSFSGIIAGLVVYLVKKKEEQEEN